MHDRTLKIFAAQKEERVLAEETIHVVNSFDVPSFEINFENVVERAHLSIFFPLIFRSLCLV